MLENGKSVKNRSTGEDPTSSYEGPSAAHHLLVFLVKKVKKKETCIILFSDQSQKMIELGTKNEGCSVVVESCTDTHIS